MRSTVLLLPGYTATPTQALRHIFVVYPDILRAIDEDHSNARGTLRRVRRRGCLAMCCTSTSSKTKFNRSRGSGAFPPHGATVENLLCDCVRSSLHAGEGRYIVQSATKLPSNETFNRFVGSRRCIVHLHEAPVSACVYITQVGTRLYRTALSRRLKGRSIVAEVLNKQWHMLVAREPWPLRHTSLSDSARKA